MAFDSPIPPASCANTHNRSSVYGYDAWPWERSHSGFPAGESSGFSSPRNVVAQIDGLGYGQHRRRMVTSPTFSALIIQRNAGSTLAPDRYTTRRSPAGMRKRTSAGRRSWRRPITPSVYSPRFDRQARLKHYVHERAPIDAGDTVLRLVDAALVERARPGSRLWSFEPVHDLARGPGAVRQAHLDRQQAAVRPFIKYGTDGWARSSWPISEARA